MGRTVRTVHHIRKKKGLDFPKLNGGEEKEEEEKRKRVGK